MAQEGQERATMSGPEKGSSVPPSVVPVIRDETAASLILRGVMVDV